jgi:erythromycin esterase-like protein
MSLATAIARLRSSPTDYDPILDRARTKDFVLIGEASHGTHEFHRMRAEITRRLITELDYSAVLVEADWPDADRVNRYVRGIGDDRDAIEALGSFERFPQWMWRNADVLDFVGWLRQHNDSLPRADRVGFHGMDLYSLHGSIGAVLAFLDDVDPEAARRARYRYGCFEHFGEDPQAYGYAASFNLEHSCEEEAISQLVELRRSAARYARNDGQMVEDEVFFAEQNARLVSSAERYYRSMFSGRGSSWNLRDTHMADTIDELRAHLRRQGRSGKLAVWAHNSHLGDCRATEMARRGELNVGQLMRERHGGRVLSVGFTTHAGTVTAASDWDAPAERKRVRPALPESYELLFHDLGVGNFLLDCTAPEARAALAKPRLERAIGVIYRPETERVSHYFKCALADQFDFVLHIDETRAVEPLERESIARDDEPPETYPTGF